MANKTKIKGLATTFYIGKELKEALRRYAFDKNISQGEAIRQSLKKFGGHKTTSATYKSQKYNIIVEAYPPVNEVFHFSILIIPTNIEPIAYALRLSEEEIEDNITETKELPNLANIVLRTAAEKLSELLKLEGRNTAWNFNIWMREFGDKNRGKSVDHVKIPRKTPGKNYGVWEKKKIKQIAKNNARK